jgi:predicted tellurium resistance membrane protein TerC
MQGKFRYLNVGLGVILAFVGVKMLLVGAPFHVHLPTPASLGVIAVVIAVSVVASLRADARDMRDGPTPPGDAGADVGDDGQATDPIDATGKNT